MRLVMWRPRTPLNSEIWPVFQHCVPDFFGNFLTRQPTRLRAMVLAHCACAENRRAACREKQ